VSPHVIRNGCRRTDITASSIFKSQLPSDDVSSRRRSSSAASTTAGREAKTADEMIPERRKSVSFFDGVDEIMKRESPRQYEKFLASKKSASSLREIQRQNELSRHRSSQSDRGIGSVGTVSKLLSWRETKSSFAGESYATSDEFSNSTAPSQFSATTNHLSESSTGNEMNPGLQNPPPLEDVFGSHANSQTDYNTENTEKTSIFSTISKSTSSHSSYSGISEENDPNIQAQPPISSIFDKPTTYESNGNKNEKGNMSIFSAISKSTTSLKINGPDGTSSTSILLSELFPALHKNDEEQSASHGKEDAKMKNPKLMYDPVQFESYHQAMTAVFDDPKMQRTISKFETRNEGIAELVKGWLMNDERILEKEVVEERWRGFKDSWKDGWAVGKAVSANRNHGDNDSARSSSVSEDYVHEENSKFLSVLKEQQEIFQSKLLNQSTFEDEPDNSTEQTSNGFEEDQKKNLPSSQFWQLSEILLASLGRYCARRARSSPMEVAWYKVKESGIVLSRDTISNYLHVVSTMGIDLLGLNRFGSNRGSTHKSLLFSSSTGGSRGGINEEDESLNNAFRIPEEVSTYHDLLSRPTESSVSLRVKALTSKGDAKGAEELLENFKESILSDPDSKELIRLRTYLPIFKLYCESKNVSAALSVFRQMQSTPGVILDPENYVLLLATIAENGFLRNDSPPIEGAIDIGYKHSCGPELFDEIATEMSNEALEITSASARRLYNSLAIGFENKDDSTGHDSLISTLKEVHPLAPMPLTMQPAQRNELVASRVILDRSTGICPVTNAHQRLILLEPEQRKQLHDELLELSREQYANYTRDESKNSGERAAQELRKFADWLDTREGEPYTAIVDGANVAYYMQTFDKGKFNLHQIKFMVDTLESLGEKPLVIIPFKYGSNEFYSSKKELQRLDPIERQIFKELNSSEKLYRVPPRCLDDYYWMLASVSDQTASRKGRDLSVPSSDPKRWPGTRPALISNDQMRDHKYGLLDPRLFRRWYGCHMVNYNFSAFVNGECVVGNEIGFSQADFFSREIQANKCSVEEVDGEENNIWGGNAWHFPVSDWDLDERFVVRIPKRQKNESTK